jgi:hypothetical protein
MVVAIMRIDTGGSKANGRSLRIRVEVTTTARIRRKKHKKEGWNHFWTKLPPCKILDRTRTSRGYRWEEETRIQEASQVQTGVTSRVKLRVVSFTRVHAN